MVSLEFKLKQIIKYGKIDELLTKEQIDKCFDSIIRICSRCKKDKKAQDIRADRTYCIACHQSQMVGNFHTRKIKKRIMRDQTIEKDYKRLKDKYIRRSL